MALDDGAAGLERNLEQRIGDLTEAAAGRGDHAAFLQHPAGDEAAAPARPAELLPEAEDAVFGKDQPVKMLRSMAQVLHLAELEMGFAVPRVGPDRRHRFREQDRVIGARIPAELRQRVKEIVQAPFRPQAGGLRGENQARNPGWLTPGLVRPQDFRSRGRVHNLWASKLEHAGRRGPSSTWLGRRQTSRGSRGVCVLHHVDGHHVDGIALAGGCPAN